MSESQWAQDVRITSLRPGPKETSYGRPIWTSTGRV